jgi:flagellar biogenesis protein FliO
MSVVSHQVRRLAVVRTQEKRDVVGVDRINRQMIILDAHLDPDRQKRAEQTPDRALRQALVAQLLDVLQKRVFGEEDGKLIGSPAIEELSIRALG